MYRKEDSCKESFPYKTNKEKNEFRNQTHHVF